MNPTGISTGSRSIAPPCVKQMCWKPFLQNITSTPLESGSLSVSLASVTLRHCTVFLHHHSKTPHLCLQTEVMSVSVTLYGSIMAASRLACGTTWHAFFKGQIKHVTLICKDKIQECFVLGRLKVGTWHSWNVACKHPRLKVPDVHKTSDGVFLLRWKRELTSIEHRMPVAKHMTNHLSLVL